MAKLLLIFAVLNSVFSFGQIDTVETIAECKAFALEQDHHYLDKSTSPLTKKERRKFKGHRFYPINMKYCVIAQFNRIENGDTVIMKTSSNTEKVYIEFAIVKFSIEGKRCELTVYQNVKLSQMNEYKDYLFLPFRDATSGHDSYGGGRYIDLLIPDSDQIVLNFNLAYNPYCAYTSGYFCPLPPEKNNLDIEIRAGVMAPAEH